MGTVKSFAEVNVADLAEWITGIPLTDWPQQWRARPEQVRPAMVTDHTWCNFDCRTNPIVTALMVHFPGCTAFNRMLSCVMPGELIEAHIDEQGPDWLARVHVPLVSNPEAWFMVGGEEWNLEVGTTYLVNTLALHGIANHGKSPRIHFMFDVRG